MKNIKVLSLFSGGGGLDIGFLKAGFNITTSVEYDSNFCETLLQNEGSYFSESHNTICADISELNPEQLPDNDIDFIIGGPPCQSFSAAGRRAGGVYGVNDTRGSLFWHFCRFIKYFNPQGFLFENVRGLLQANKKEDWEVIKASFEELGYTLSYRVLDAADYGVPQHRERLILVGVKNHKFQFPRPTHGSDSKNNTPHVSIKEALMDIDDPNEVVPPYGGKYGELLEEVPPGMNYLYFTEKMGHPRPRFAWRSRFSDFLYKADPDVPCKTIVANQGRYGGPFHWRGRKFTLEELKRLQTFPDDYHLKGSFNVAWKQVGNSVAPKFAEAIAKTIMNQIFDENQFRGIDTLNHEEKLSFDGRKKKKANKTRSKASQNEYNQLNLFDSKITEFTETENFKNKWIYENPQKMTDINSSDNYNHGEYLLDFHLAEGVCNVEAEKANSNNQVNIFIDLKFEYPIADRLLGIKVNLKTNTLWDIFVSWDAIHKAVKEFTSYEDLQPLFGHFTEPYPKFKFDMEIKGEHEVQLKKFLSNLNNFKYLAQEHPMESLKGIFPRKSPLETVRLLREIGYDIRVHETNRAIPKGYFRVCYPFTLSKGSVNFVKWQNVGDHKTADFNISYLKEEEDRVSPRLEKSVIENELDNIYHEALSLEENDSLSLNKETKDFIEGFSKQIDGAKTAFTNLVTCLAATVCDPDVDPRYHRPPSEGMVNPPEGKTYFPGRSISENVIYRWLSRKGFRHAKSGWQTRTFERPRPYKLDYPENVGKVKNEFLNILHLVAKEEESASEVLMYFFYLEIKAKEKKGESISNLAKTRVSEDTLIKDIIESFEKHFSEPRSSRLPVLAIYATYQAVMNEVGKYKDQDLIPLSEHSASDVRTNALGDIEIADTDGDIVEAVEIKHDIEIDDIIAMKAEEKIKKSTVDRYYILTTHPNCSIMNEDVRNIVETVHEEHHCELIVNGVLPTIKYYCRLLSQPKVVIENYSKLLREDSVITNNLIDSWMSITENLNKQATVSTRKNV